MTKRNRIIIMYLKMEIIMMLISWMYKIKTTIMDSTEKNSSLKTTYILKIEILTLKLFKKKMKVKIRAIMIIIISLQSILSKAQKRLRIHKIHITTTKI
jgi:hypothetical protein